MRSYAIYRSNSLGRSGIGWAPKRPMAVVPCPTYPTFLTLRRERYIEMNCMLAYTHSTLRKRRELTDHLQKVGQSGFSTKTRIISGAYAGRQVGQGRAVGQTTCLCENKRYRSVGWCMQNRCDTKKNLTNRLTPAATCCTVEA